MIYKVLIVLLIVGILVFVFKKQIMFFYVGFTKQKRIQRKIYKQCKKNNYLVISDLLIQVSENKFRHIDSLIFGDKYIYIVKEPIWIGTLKGLMIDNTWLLYYKDSLSHVKNPFKENQTKIERLVKLTNLDRSNFKSIVALSKTTVPEDIKIESDFEYLCQENEVIVSIQAIEKEATIGKYDPQEVEKYAKAFYHHAKECEKLVKLGGK